MTSLQKRSARNMPLRELTASTAMPIATVSANLMPPGVLAKRRVSWLKRRLAFALLALVALLGCAYLLAHQSTSSSRDDLATAQNETLGLQRRIAGFAGLQQLQDETAQIRNQLRMGMAADIRWDQLMSSVTAVAPKGVTVTDIAAKLSADDINSAAAALPGAMVNGVPGIGTLEVSGKTDDYRTVATYVDNLGRSKLFGSVEPKTLSTANGHATFTLNAKLKLTALSGRYLKTGDR